MVGWGLGRTGIMNNDAVRQLQAHVFLVARFLAQSTRSLCSRPHGFGKVHDTRPAGLAGGPSPPRREAAGDRAVWPVALFGEEIAEGWDRAIGVGCAMQGSRLERGSKRTGGRESEHAGPPL